MQTPDINKLVKENVNKDIREELGTTDIQVVKRGDTEKEAEAKHERLRHIVGVERALKSAGVSNNSKCPCGSEVKFKKCCKPKLRDNNYPVDYITDKLKLRRKDEFMVTKIKDHMGI